MSRRNSAVDCDDSFRWSVIDIDKNYSVNDVTVVNIKSLPLQHNEWIEADLSAGNPSHSSSGLVQQRRRSSAASRRKSSNFTGGTIFEEATDATTTSSNFQNEEEDSTGEKDLECCWAHRGEKKKKKHSDKCHDTEKANYTEENEERNNSNASTSTKTTRSSANTTNGSSVDSHHSFSSGKPIVKSFSIEKKEFEESIMDNTENNTHKENSSFNDGIWFPVSFPKSDRKNDGALDQRQKYEEGDSEVSQGVEESEQRQEEPKHEPQIHKHESGQGQQSGDDLNKKTMIKLKKPKCDGENSQKRKTTFLFPDEQIARTYSQVDIFEEKSVTQQPEKSKNSQQEADDYSHTEDTARSAEGERLQDIHGSSGSVLESGSASGEERKENRGSKRIKGERVRKYRQASRLNAHMIRQTLSRRKIDRNIDTKKLRRERRKDSMTPELSILHSEDEFDVQSDISDDSLEQGHQPAGLLRRTCLKPDYSLQKQLFLSFWLVSATAISFVVLTGIVTTTMAGNRIESKSRDELTNWTLTDLGSQSRYAAETVTKILDFGLTSIIEEATKDRFVGYPDQPGFADDLNVPFFDIETNRNQYPLDEPLLPLDWEYEPNVNKDNYKEHVQDRWKWYGGDDAEISTATSIYRMQGQCDPSVIDPTSKLYYPDCTDANNNITTGGVVQPTSMNQHIAHKGSDLSFLLKALYEYHQNAKLVGIYFSNEGAGSVISFPSQRRDGRSTYTSLGCDWMRKRNPIFKKMGISRPIGSEEEINRCHPKGSEVSGREYNPLERSWCREQALDPFKSHIVGPYPDAFVGDLLLTIGKAVYDKITNDFIGCTLADVTIDRLSQVIEGAVSEKASDIALVRWDNDGTLVSSSSWDSSSATSTTTIFDEDIGMGIDRETFEAVKSRIDFGGVWDPQDVRVAYERAFEQNGKFISGYPVPVPPEVYDESYQPEFVVFVSFDKEEALVVVGEIRDDIDGKVKSIVRNIVMVGVVGLCVILFFVFVESIHLTRPLRWMNDVGEQIIDQFGEKTSDVLIDYSQGLGFRCIPETEIRSLVKEFQEMVQDFSGKGTTAKVVKSDIIETKNPFLLFAAFGDLFQSRQNQEFPCGYGKMPVVGLDNKGGDVPEHHKATKTKSLVPVLTPRRRNFGQNVRAKDSNTTYNLINVRDSAGRKVLSSPLFWWIVCCIVVPLLVTMTFISFLVIWNVSSELPSLVYDVEDAYLQNAATSLELASQLRASFAEQVMGGSLRDLNVFARAANWFLLDQVKRSSTFTEMNSGVKECKDVSPIETCDYFSDPLTCPCDCAWKDSYGVNCTTYEINESRQLQKLWYAGQSQDMWPNGDRNSTSFPSLSYSPSTTDWWGDVSLVPGSERGKMASGYDTTYDRLRVSSALSVVQIPLYNYHSSTSSNTNLGLYEGFESDGMLLGYTGCDHGHATFAGWSSTESNGASDIRPDLCPLGKYGYDSRCRDWYGTGKKLSEEGGAPLYVTAPYKFASSKTIAQSATMPLNDTNNGKYIGQALADFLPGDIIDSLLERTSLAPQGFPVLITAKVDNFGADTVIGPGYSFNSKGSVIGDLVLPFDCSGDDPQCVNRQEFDDIVEDMRSGKQGSKAFKRTNEYGEEEKVSFAYAPVFGVSLAPKNSSDFSRGVDVHQSLVYSLALAEPYSGLLGPFEDIRSTVQQQGKISFGILVLFIFLAMVVMTYISWRVNVSVTVPISQLLAVVRDMNRCDIKEGMPEIFGGSRELSRVYGTFENLFKVVRFANSAYFSGDLEKAYEVLVDALALFRQMKNEKAVSVATNNLGNMMLTMYCVLQDTGESHICGLSKNEIITKGTAYFDEAIHIGEEAIERTEKEAGYSLDHLEFLLQLSNRYFNRAMFLLTVRNDHKSPEEAENLGLRDLSIARGTHKELTERSQVSGRFISDEEEHFNLVLKRIRGLILLMEMSYSFDWDIEYLLEDALKILGDASKNPTSKLFVDLGPVGQTQLLECALIDFMKNDKFLVVDSARIAIRMLVEDEYVNPVAGVKSIQALIDYIDDGGMSCTKSYLKQVKKKLMDYKSEFSNWTENFLEVESNCCLSGATNIMDCLTMETF